MPNEKTTIKLSLTAEDFQALVSGKAVNRDGVSIILKDIGFSQMRYSIEVAEQMPAEGFQVVPGFPGQTMVKCRCGQVTHLTRLRDLHMANDQGGVRCPACGLSGTI